MAIDISELGPGVAALGELIGILNPGSAAGTVELNPAWMQNPVASLEQIETRLDDLSAAIAAMFGPASADGPAVFDGAGWYSIPNPGTGTGTGLYLVTTSAEQPSGQMGIGTYWSAQVGKVTVTLSLYFPFFSYDSTGAQMLVGSPTDGIQVALNATSSNGFTVNPASGGTGGETSSGTVTFSGMEIVGEFFLADQSPTFELSFQNLQGASPSTYTTLAALLNSQVESWISEVLLKASGWLGYSTPSPSYSYGDLLEAAQFLSVNYLLETGSFAGSHVDELVKDLQTTDNTSSFGQICRQLWGKFSSTDQATLKNTASTPEEKIAALIDALNPIIQGPSLYDPTLFEDIEVPPQVLLLIAGNPVGADLIKLNRLLLQSLFPTVIVSNDYQFDLQNFQGSASQIVLNLMTAVLNIFVETKFPLAYLPGGGSVSFTSEDDGSGDVTYGLNVNAEIPLDAANPTASGSSAPVITLALGTLLTGDTAANNWLTRSAVGTTIDTAPGISLFGVTKTSSGVTFAPGIILGSVGFNFSRADKQPLISVDGFTLGGIELRFYLNSDGWTYGFAAKLDHLGVPLGPGFNTPASGADSNPVAQSLLESGSTKSVAPTPNPVNPAFSVAGGYLSGGEFVVQLYDSKDAPAKVVTIPMQRAFGPLLCQSIGIGWVQDETTPAHDQLSFLFNGSVEVGPLEVDLTGLSIGIPITTPTEAANYTLDLQGMGVAFEAGSVSLSAALVKVEANAAASPPRQYPEYDGEVLLKAGSFAVNAIGSYAQVVTSGDSAGFTSLFAFGVFNGDLGGPACFYITGLAAGFGYNRSLKLPDMNGVATFPLVVAASDPTKLGGTPPDPAKALQGLDAVVPPDQGEYWLAAGLRFTSFDLINSTALLTVEFGNELEIGLLGLSWISLPPPAAPGASEPAKVYAYAELGIEVVVLPEQGEFTATAILTPNSFVIDPACHLTGGFAFYVWFGDNPYAGQFVLTIGGYHPAFQPPSYYPQVPRLGFNWALPSNVTIQGDAYFALTPSAVMAGGGLQVLYAKGNLQAWFTAEMDALIEWAPFYYNIDLGVSIGASYRATIFGVHKTFTVSLSASINLWGPKMGGSVRVHWFIISFTVNFGADDSSEPTPLAWTSDDGTGFAQTLLPHQATTSNSSDALSRTLSAGAAAATGTVTPAGILSIIVNDGLLKTFTDSNGNTVWVVRPSQFVFSMTSAIPCTEVQITPAADEPAGTQTAISESGYTVYFRPMGATLSASQLTLTLFSVTQNATADLAGQFTYDTALQSVPAAKYGAPLTAGQSPEMNELLTGRLMGLQNITPNPPTLTPSGTGLLAVNVAAAFTYDVVDEGETNHLPLTTVPPVASSSPQPSDNTCVTIAATMMTENVIAQRTAIFEALQLYGVNPRTNGPVNTFSSNPGNYLSGNPLVAA